MIKIDPNNIDINKVTENDLLMFIKEQGKYDDWRDLFQHIHNWGYNTDFTYNDITNPEEHSSVEYLAAYIEDIYGDEE